MTEASPLSSRPLFRHQLTSAALMQSMVALTLTFLNSELRSKGDISEFYVSSYLPSLLPAGCIVIAIALRNFLLRQVAKKKPETLAQAAHLSFTPHLISMVLVEASVISGFVLANQTGDETPLIALTAIGLALSLVFFPTERKLRAQFSLGRLK